jgi:adenylate cyclase
MAQLLVKMGRPAEAQLYVNEALRLNPQEDYSWRLASIQFHLERYDDAIEIILNRIENDSDDEWLYFLLAASYGHLGREAEGKEAIRKFEELRAKMGITLSYRVSGLSWWSYKDDATLDRIRKGLLKECMPF